MNLLYTYLKTTFKCKYINKKQYLKNPCNSLISLFKYCVQIILGSVIPLGKKSTKIIILIIKTIVGLWINCKKQIEDFPFKQLSSTYATVTFSRKPKKKIEKPLLSKKMVIFRNTSLFKSKFV